jgi:hypothetical protein
MDTTSALASRFFLGRTAKSMVAMGVVGCLAVGSFTAAVTGAGAALSAQPPEAISVNHTNKGDRLSLAIKHTPSISSPSVSTLSRPPIGCEPAFSRAADPARAHIFGRCLS